MRLLRPTAASCVSGTLSMHVLHVTSTARRSVHRHKIVRAFEASADWRLQVAFRNTYIYLTYPYLPSTKGCSVSLVVDSIGIRRLKFPTAASSHLSGGTCMLRKWTSLAALCCWKRRLWTATLPISSILSLSAKCSILVTKLWENWGMVRKLRCGCVGMLGR